MGPPPWSFAADAYDCIMVQVKTEPTGYKFVARWSRLDGELPSDCLAPTAGLLGTGVGAVREVVGIDDGVVSGW